MEARKNNSLYQYRVWHPEHGETEVTAEDRLHAITEAAKSWGVRWTGIARGCECERLGMAAEKANRTTARKKGAKRNAQ